MKLYLSINKSPLNGYIHIDPAPANGNNAFCGNLLNLTNIVYFNECSEIIVEHLLDSLDYNTRQTALKHFYNLLKPEGKIIIIGNDIIEIAKSLLINEIDVSTVNKILYDRKSIDELSSLADSLKLCGFTITKQRLHLHQYYIEGTK